MFWNSLWNTLWLLSERGAIWINVTYFTKNSTSLTFLSLSDNSFPVSVHTFSSQRQQLLGQAGQKGPLSHILSQKQYLNTLTAHWKPFDHAWFLYETPTAELYLSSKLHAENMNSPNKNWHAFCFDTVTHERLISAGSKQHLKSNLIHLCVKCVSVQSWEVQLIRTEEAEKFVAEI